MSNIRVDIGYPITDGTEIKFRSPADCSAVTGLKVYYPGSNGATASKAFTLADAHGNNVGNINHLFAEDVVVKVILDVTKSMAFVQNADTNAYLESHIQSKNNPHGVTTAQIGAIPSAGGNVSGYLDFTDYSRGLRWTTADGTIIQVRPYSPGNTFQITMQNPDNGVSEYSAVSINTDGTWSFSKPGNVRDALGAAPSGYGLGGNAKTLGNISSLSDVDNIKENGWYSFKLPSSTQYAGVWMDYIHMRVDAYNANAGRQTIYPLNSYGSILHRQLINGKRGEWECENPPMAAGVEYRTTERYLGKAVYVKLINYGKLAAANTTVTIPTGASAITNIVDFVLFHKVSSGNVYKYPAHSVSDGTLFMSGGYYQPSNKSLVFKMNGDLSTQTAVVVVKYTKD